MGLILLFKKLSGQTLWYMPVFLATHEVRERRKVSSRLFLKNKTQKPKGWGHRSSAVLECIEDLGSIPSSSKHIDR
jgi:hypothetical protein